MISFKNEEEAIILADIKGLNDMRQNTSYENRFDKLEKIVLEGFDKILKRLDKVENDIEFLKDNVKAIWLKIEEIETNTKHVWKQQN